MDPHIQALASQLAIDPENWDLRRQVVLKPFRQRAQRRTAKVISNAPMIPEDEEAIHFAAKVYASVSPEHGIQLLDELHAMNPSHAAGHLLRAKILKKLGDTDAARESYAAAVATDPRWPTMIWRRKSDSKATAQRRSPLSRSSRWRSPPRSQRKSMRLKST
ncbi:MAG: hypothetical protein R3F11_17330 [Verrucomicrobiales bacterium]